MFSLKLQQGFSLHGKRTAPFKPLTLKLSKINIKDQNLRRNFKKEWVSFRCTAEWSSEKERVISFPNHAPVRAAFFDVDGTVTKSNVVMAFLMTQLAELSLFAKLFWVPYFAVNVILYLILDSIDRALFNRVFYRNYRGKSVQSKSKIATLVHEKYLKLKAFPRALKHIEALKSRGFKVVFVTGSLDFIVAPLASELGVDAVFAAQLKEKDGKFTGELEGDAVSSEEKALLVKRYASENGILLENCHAYGDSIADLQMLESVGFPHAVKPDKKLRAIAVERSWPVIEWEEIEAEKEYLTLSV